MPSTIRLLAVCALFIGLCTATAASPGGEPTNAQEAAAKKAAADKAVDDKFQQWKATLPAEQQAWESTLEQCLGAFYLPLYKQDKVRRAVTAWDYVKDDPKLPRVLLIGDSISRGYTLAVRKALAGKVNVHRAPENCGPTANGLKKLDIWLGDGKWDVIHFNFGIHDRRTAPAEYRQRLEAILVRLQQTGATLIWASTTPVPPDTKDGPAVSAAIVERNAIAASVMKERGIAIDDLFTCITPHVAKTQNPKDCHFNGEGYELLGEQVAASLEAALQAKETLDLIIVAGQSNAVGFDARPEGLPADPNDRQILFWWRCGDPPPDEHDSTSGGKWTRLQPQALCNPKQPRKDRQYGNFGQPEGGFGPEIGLARALYAAEGKRLAVVKAAFSGTGMRSDWNISGPGGECYRALLAEVKAAIAAANAQSIRLRPRALAWVQGESDANQQDAAVYQQALGQMIEALRKEIDAPGLIAMLAVNTRFGAGKNAFMPRIVEAQKALAGRDPACVYVDTSNAAIANAVHFNAEGTLAVGRQFAEALLRVEKDRRSK